MKTNLSKLSAALIFAALFSTTLQAQTVLDDEHADIGLGYNGDWDLHVHDEDNDIEYEPDQVILFAGANTRSSANAFQSGFAGMAQGEDIWVLPQSLTQNPDALFLGVGTEIDMGFTFGDWNPMDSRIAAGDFDWFQLTLESFSGPGDFSVYTNDNTVWMSTANTPANGNHLYIFSHDHFNWAFSEVGLYEVGFSVTGFLNGTGMVTSPTTIYTFGVETVPEPTSAALLLGAAGLLALRRRKAN